jgi:hypothetical protein
MESCQPIKKLKKKEEEEEEENDDEDEDCYEQLSLEHSKYYII